MTSSRTVVCLCCMLIPPVAEAGVGSATLRAIRKAAGQAGRTAASQTASTAAREGAELGASRASALAARHFAATVATSSAFADDFAVAATRLSPRNYRRLAQLAPELERAGASASVVRRLGSVGSADEYIEMLWRHKGKIATAAATGALVIHGDAVVETAGEHVARPIIEGVAAPIGRGVGYVVIPAIAIVCLLAVGALIYGGPAADRLKRLFVRICERRRQVR